ncbi:hypothetical protein QE250_04230 [Chromatiaceae bacterium AAb-1]|nr:hypothetical protein [Chromatiaceae bacterium AAb-1]
MAILFPVAAQAALPGIWQNNNSYFAISGFAEHSGKSEGSGASLAWQFISRNDVSVETGFSYQRLRLRQTPQRYAGSAVNPLFAYLRIGLDWPVSPYLQGGVDIGDSLLHWVGDNERYCCTSHLQAGIAVKLHANLRLDLYGSWYNVRYDSGYRGRSYYSYPDNGYYYPNPDPDSRYYDYGRERFSTANAGARLSVLF